jgi:tRNA G18 (ribose-2'-O)-methylase SpoU
MAESSPPNDIVPPHPQVTLLIENPRKTNNWGPLLRCCAAFGIRQVFVVGFDKCNVRGSHGASKHVELIAFPSHQGAVDALTQDGFQLVGLLQGVPNAYDEQGYPTVQKVIMNETTNETDVLVVVSGVDGASDEGNNSGNNSGSSSSNPVLVLPQKSFPVHSRPFAKKTCLVVGKKTKGLVWSLAQYCHSFVHIPHEGILLAPDGSRECTAPSWLTVEASVSIVLHEYSAWAGYHNHDRGDTEYQGQKYKVEQISRGSQNSTPGDKQEQRKQRQQDLQELSETAMDDGCLGNLLMGEDGNGGDY